MELTIKTTKHHELIDITQKVKDFIKKENIKDGAMLIHSAHTTTAIVINENEERLLDDFKEFLEKLAPTNGDYKHDNIEKRNCPEDEPKNGHAHLKTILLSPSITIPIENEKLQLGTWQSIFLCEFDGPRTRKVILKIIS